MIPDDLTLLSAWAPWERPYGAVLLRCSVDRVPLRLRVLAADRCGWPRPPRRGLLCRWGPGSLSLARVQRPWQGRHLGDLRTPIREAGPPQSLGVTGARTEVVLRAERPRRHQAASRMESELHAARGLYPRPGPAGRRKGPGAQGAGVGRGRDGMGTETGTGTGTGQGPGQRWGQDQEAVWAPGQAPLTLRLSQTGESLGPSRPPCSHLGESVLLYVTVPCVEASQAEEGGHTARLRCGLAGRPATPHSEGPLSLTRRSCLSGHWDCKGPGVRPSDPLGVLVPSSGPAAFTLRPDRPARSWHPLSRPQLTAIVCFALILGSRGRRRIPVICLGPALTVWRDTVKSV